MFDTPEFIGYLATNWFGKPVGEGDDLAMSEPEPGDPWELLLFEVGGRRLSLPIVAVREVLRIVTIVPLPGAGAGVEGVINCRGTVVPVLDLRAWLGLPPVPAEPDHHLVIAEGEGRLVGLRVDRALELMGRGDAADALGGERDGVAGLAKRPDGLVVILDPARLSARARAAIDGEPDEAAGGEPGGRGTS